MSTPTGHLQVTELVGDYNSDGRIDAIDYNVWRATLGQSPAIAGTLSDGNGDGLVNAFDYDVWRAQFGQSAMQILSFGATHTSADSHSVPEPTAILWGALIVFVHQPRRSAAATGKGQPDLTGPGFTPYPARPIPASG